MPTAIGIAPTAGPALPVLDALPVNGLAPAAGYNATQFGPQWSDDTDDVDGHNACDTADDILRRDLTDVVLASDSNGCRVLSGVLNDPYTGAQITFVRTTVPQRVQVDYVVPLEHAWQTGAQELDRDQRAEFANDPLNLIAAGATEVEQRSKVGVEDWLPPDYNFKCAYAARQIAVTSKYHLWITARDQSRLQRTLVLCSGLQLPAEPGNVAAVPPAA